jgi:tetratricopeptide (TPR) repeat protein
VLDLSKGRIALCAFRRSIVLAGAILAIFTGADGFEKCLAQAASPISKKEPELYREGMRLLREGNYPAALNQFKKLETDIPDSPEGCAGEGIALALTGKPEEAVRTLRRALAIDPGYLVARRELGIVDWELNRKDEAAAELREVLKSVPSDDSVSAILGEYSFEKAKYTDAVDFFAKARARVDASPNLSLIEADALIRCRHLEEAVLRLNRVSAKANLTSQERFRLAWLFGQAGAYLQAIQIFQSLPSDFSDSFGRDYGIALAYYENGQNDECIRVLNSLRERGATRAEIFSLLGAAEEASGHSKEAYDAFRSGIEEFPQEDTSYLNSATVAIQYQEYAAAVQIMTLGIQRIPGDYKLFLTRGVTYTLWGDLNKAETDYVKSVSLAPDEPSTYVALGICYMDKHQNTAAAAIFRQAIQRGLQDVRLYYYLVDVLLGQDLTQPAVYQEALDAINASIRFEPKFAYSYFQRGRLQLGKGNLELAIADLEYARTLDPDSNDPAITYQLALAYRDAGKKSEAGQLLSQVSKAIKKQEDGYRQETLTSVIGSGVGTGFAVH